MSQHQSFVQMLARRIELTASEEAELRRHLNGCLDCRKIATDYARQTTLLQALPQVDVPSVLRQRVLAGIHEPRSGRRLPFPFVWPRPGLLVAPVAAALLVFAAVLGYAHFPRSAPQAALKQIVTARPRQSGAPPKSHLPNTARAIPRDRSVTRQHHQTSGTLVPVSPLIAPTRGNYQGVAAATAASLPVVGLKLSTPAPPTQQRFAAALPTTASRRKHALAPPIIFSPAPTPTSTVGVASVAAPIAPSTTPTLGPIGASALRPTSGTATPSPTAPADPPPATPTPNSPPTQPPGIHPVTPTTVPTPTP
jgi:hypothetical protein